MTWSIKLSYFLYVNPLIVGSTYLPRQHILLPQIKVKIAHRIG